MIETPSDIEVQPATLADLKYVDHLQRKNAEDLAFYPRSAFEREKDASKWAYARKRGSSSSRFLRGGNMDEYRREIEAMAEREND